MKRARAFFAASFCSGRGIEIGALHHPFELPENTKVRYVDRMSEEDLRKQYPELNDKKLVHVDIIENGENLQSLPDGQEHFIIASQFIEHCENPIRALVNMLRVIDNNGVIILTIPDKRITFDKTRPLTSNEHLMDECTHGPEKNRRMHFVEYAIHCNDKKEGEEAEKHADYLLDLNYSIHYHVWDPDHFLKFLLFTKEFLKLPFEISATYMNLEELLVVLTKKI